MSILQILLLIFCIYDLYKNKQILSPSFLFNFIFFVSYTLYQWDFSFIQQRLSDRTELIFLTCVIFFNLTYYYLKNKQWKIDDFSFLKKIIKIKSSSDFSSNNRVRVIKYIAIFIFIIELIYSRGCPLLWKFTGDTRTYFDFGIPSLNGALYGLIICMGAYTIFTKSKDKYIYLLMAILMISRQIVISIIIEGLIFFVFNSKNKINYKKISILAATIFIGFAIVGNFRSGNNVMDEVFSPKRKYNKLPTSVKWTYSYMTFSISNFNNLVGMTEGGVNHGASTLSEFMPTVILNKVNIKQNFSNNYLINPSYNVSTYLPSIYLDFGIVGIAIFNMLIAALGYYLYKNATENKNDKNVLLYAVYAHNIILLFFINMFLYLPVIVQFIYIPLIFGNIKKNKKKLKEA